MRNSTPLAIHLRIIAGLTARSARSNIQLVTCAQHPKTGISSLRKMATYTWYRPQQLLPATPSTVDSSAAKAAINAICGKV
jgi:hypothetical protein